MNNNENLIEEAKAGLEAFDAYWGDGGPVDPAYGRPWEIVRRLLAAFEKAHTPTDGERLDIISAASDAFKARGGAPDWEEDAVARDLIIRWHLRGFEDGLAAGFRRSGDVR